MPCTATAPNTNAPHEGRTACAKEHTMLNLNATNDRAEHHETMCKLALRFCDGCRDDDALLMAAWDRAVFHRYEAEAARAIDLQAVAANELELPSDTCCPECGGHAYDPDCDSCRDSMREALADSNTLAVCDQCGCLHAKVNDPGLDGHYCPTCTDVIYDTTSSELERGGCKNCGMADHLHTTERGIDGSIWVACPTTMDRN